MAPRVELAELEDAILAACRAETEWPARIAAGVYAGIDFAILNPDILEAVSPSLESEAERLAGYEALIARLTRFLQDEAPSGTRLPGSTDEALVGGVVGLVGDHLRLDRADRLGELRPDLALLVLLPYLGFAEAKSWATRASSSD